MLSSLGRGGESEVGRSDPDGTPQTRDYTSCPMSRSEVVVVKEVVEEGCGLDREIFGLLL